MKFKSQAIVLSRLPVRESDLILTLLTAEQGRISAVARGAQRSKRRFMGGVDLFDCAVFEFSPGRQSGNRSDSLLALDSIAEREVWLGLREDLKKFSLGMLMLELMQNFLPEGDSDGSKMFTPLHAALSRISKARSGDEAVLCAVLFLLVTLEYAGVSPLAATRTEDQSCLKFFDATGLLMLQSEQGLATILDSDIIDMLLGPTGAIADPATAAALRDDFFYLLDYTEHTLGHRLKCRDDAITQMI